MLLMILIHRTSKKAYSLLKSKKIIVKKNLLKNKAIKLYKKYFYHKKNKLPYVIGKIACSKDKFIYSNKKILQINIQKTFLIC